MERSCADEIGRRLGSQGLACAESVTAGLIAQELAAVRGSMEWFRGGLIAYQRRTKIDVLGVQPGPLVTPTVAEQMALGVARLLSADVAVSVTGAAGPEPLDGAEPGTVVVGVFVEWQCSLVQPLLPGRAGRDLPRRTRRCAAGTARRAAQYRDESQRVNVVATR